MILPIVLHPDQYLRQENLPITEIDDELLALLDNLYDTLIAHDGLGIAAPQVGKNVQVALIDDEEYGIIELINPEIVASSGSDIQPEGCLSIPNVYGTVERATAVTVRFFDRDGEEGEMDFTGESARSIQHELDHLQGVLFIDKLITPLTSEELTAYYENAEDEAKEDFHD